MPWLLFPSESNQLLSINGWHEETYENAKKRAIETLLILSARMDLGILIIVFTRLNTDCEYPSMATTAASSIRNSFNIYGITGPHKVAAKNTANMITHNKRNNDPNS